LLLGPASGIVDVDLDCEEAVALAPHFLPPTCTFGRASAPRSHYLYRVAERSASRRYEIGDEVLLEYRDASEKGTPLQTMIPPSVHPSGERVLFDAGADPSEIAEIGATELQARAERLAAAAALARLWPRRSGGRHKAALALATVLAKSGLSVTE